MDDLWAASEQLKLLHRLVAEYVDRTHQGGDTFKIQMDLRGELALTHVKLPMCLALIDPIGDLSIPAFDRFASSALAELERAHGVVWKGRMEGVIGSPRFDATFAASQDATGQDETDGPRTEDRP